jgi:SAM-dependent methyltransferase
MYLAQKARQVLRGMLQTYGTEGMKRSLWNSEFSGGRWSCLDSTPEDYIYPIVEHYAGGGSILDLGCGSGSTGNELTEGSYRRYTGVDISDAAIEKAAARSATNNRSATNEYFQSDVVRYEPKQSYDVILFRDSIYYVPRASVAPMLVRYSKSLTGRGVFVVRMANADEKYRAFVEAIEHSFDVLARERSHQPEALVLVFRPKRS